MFFYVFRIHILNYYTIGKYVGGVFRGSTDEGQVRFEGSLLVIRLKIVVFSQKGQHLQVYLP